MSSYIDSIKITTSLWLAANEPECYSGRQSTKGKTPRERSLPDNIVHTSGSYCSRQLTIKEPQMATGKQVRYRSAITGEYVKPSYAVSHPKITVKETTKGGK